MSAAFGSLSLPSVIYLSVLKMHARLEETRVARSAHLYSFKYRACSENKRYCGGAPALRRVAPSARMADPISDDEPGMADAKRRKQPSQAVAPIAAPNAPAAWPSSSELYANGLEHRAAAAPQAAPGQTWTVSGQSWRNEHMSQSDADGSVLRQRQQEARRAMLQRR